MAQLEYFVADEGGTHGPLPAEAARAMLSVEKHVQPRVRVEGCEPWLSPEVWEGLADLRPPPPVPPPPAAGPATRLIPELSGIAPSVRERLLWFVADGDGVMGPVSGEFVRKAIASGKIKLQTGICLVSTTSWVRASIAFPAAIDGATIVRPRPVATFPCAACLEPCVPADTECNACGEPIRPAARTPSVGAIVSVVIAAFVVVLAVSIGAGALVRSRLGGCLPTSASRIA